MSVIADRNIGSHPLLPDAGQLSALSHQSHCVSDQWIDWEIYQFFNIDVARMYPTVEGTLRHYATYGRHEHRQFLITSTPTAAAQGVISVKQKLQRIYRSIEPSKPAILFIYHGMSTRLGGVGTYIHHLYDLLAPHYHIVALYPWSEGTDPIFRLVIDNQWVRQYSDSTELGDTLKSCNFAGIIMAHFLNFHVDKLEHLICNGPLASVPLITTIHDYFWLASTIPVPQVRADFARISRSTGKHFWVRSSVVVVPSKDVKDEHLLHYESEPAYAHAPMNVIVVPHQEFDYSLAPEERCQTTSSLLPRRFRVLCTGTLYIWYKGAAQVIMAARSFPGIDFVVLGDIDCAELPANVSVRGRYKEHDLAALIASENPDIIWTPGKYRESYCYNLDHHMQSGYPLLLPDMPIYHERTALYKGDVTFYPTGHVDPVLLLLSQQPPAQLIHPARLISTCSREYLSLTAEHFGLTQKNCIRDVLREWYPAIASDDLDEASTSSSVSL